MELVHEKIGKAIDLGVIGALRDCSTDPPKASKDLPRFLGLPILFYSVKEIVIISMNQYAKEKIRPMDLSNCKDPEADLLPAQITQYRGLVGSLAWLAGSVKPGLSVVSSLSAGQKFKVASATALNKLVGSLNFSTNMLKFVKLDIAETCYIYVYSDSSLYNNADHTTQTGYTIFLGESYKNRTSINVNLIDWQSSKLRRVVKSTYA